MYVARAIEVKYASFARYSRSFDEDPRSRAADVCVCLFFSSIYFLYKPGIPGSWYGMRVDSKSSPRHLPLCSSRFTDAAEAVHGQRWQRTTRAVAGRRRPVGDPLGPARGGSPRALEQAGALPRCPPVPLVHEVVGEAGCGCRRCYRRHREASRRRSQPRSR